MIMTLAAEKQSWKEKHDKIFSLSTIARHKKINPENRDPSSGRFLIFRSSLFQL